jgi:uncharacterized protein YegL
MATSAQKGGRKKTSAKPAATDTLHVALVVDMSGSMGGVWDATLAGMNQYISDLKNQEGETLFSLTAFDTVFEQWHIAEPVQKIPHIGKDRYSPRGMTALYDAIANTIVQTEARLNTQGRQDEKVLVVIITDGLENSSQDYALENNGRRRLFELVQRYEAKGNWTFSYIGADVDAYAEAGAIGVPVGNTVMASSTPGSTSAAYANLSAGTTGLRSSSGGTTTSMYTDVGVSQDVTEEAGYELPEDSPYRSTASDDIKKAKGR